MKINTIKYVLLSILLLSTPTLLHAQNALNEKIPKRIISLKPNITELLFALGVGDKLVGVTTWCDKPEAAKKLPKVADYIKPNVEKILALKPDLIIASKENSVKAPFKILKDSGIEVIYLSFKSIAELFDAVDRLAKVTGHEEEGKVLVKKMTSALSLRAPAKQSSEDTRLPRRGVYPERVIASRRTPRNDNAPKALIIVGKRPLVVAGTRSFLNELVELAGGKNIIDSKIPYPHINMETVIAREPDVIIDFSMGSESKGFVSLGSRFYSLDISEFRLGPNLVEQIETLKQIMDNEKNITVRASATSRELLDSADAPLEE